MIDQAGRDRRTVLDGNPIGTSLGTEGGVSVLLGITVAGRHIVHPALGCCSALGLSPK